MTEPADAIVALYERHAAGFAADRAARPWVERAWHERFAAALGAGARVLDLGCGPGEPVARMMAEMGLRVTGVDSSPSLIAMCRERLPDHDWHVADMRTLDLAHRFDGILAWDSFFHLSHDAQRRMFPILQAHAAPDAFLMLNTGHAHGVALGRYRGETLHHASLAPDEYRTLLAAAGFSVVDHAERDPLAGGRTVWLARATG